MSASFVDHDQARDGKPLTPEQREWIRTLYLAEVQFVDEQIGRVLDYLENEGLYEESLIILTSDHGEEFWEHGGYEHGHSTFQEVIAVPLMIKLPGARGRTDIQDFVSTAGVASTVLDLAGLDYRGPCRPAVSLKPFWNRQGSQPSADYLISRSNLYGEDQETVLFNGLKLIQWSKTGHEALYDLRADALEQQPLEADSPEAVLGHELLVRMRDLCADLRRCYAPVEREDPSKLRPEDRERLRSLGYIK
jgi:arylsulfatase A-like enzyme